MDHRQKCRESIAGSPKGSGAASYDRGVAALLEVGLREGEEVRFRRSDRRRWQLGRARCVERDGSIGITDRDGASRSVARAQVEVRKAGARGGTGWEPLLDRVARTEQLSFL